MRTSHAWLTRVATPAVALALPVALAGPAGAAPADGPVGARSNMGLCSPYLASLAAPADPLTGETLGGNARSGVNLLIKEIGPLLPDHLQSPGQLYRVRAQEHPADSAQAECLPRPAPGSSGP